MKLTASVVGDYYRRSKCPLRAYLRARGEHEEPPGPYERVLHRLGRRHEAEYLAAQPAFVDLRDDAIEERVARTLEALASGIAALYHPVFVGDVALGGETCTLFGEPDFVVREKGGHALRDCTIARRVDEETHPEIFRELELCGWLYERTTGRAPTALEVFSGTGEMIDVPYDGGRRALADLEEIVAIRSAASEPATPVGSSWCGPCCFHDRCWSIAERNHDLGLLSGMDQSLALTLYGDGVRTYDDLLARFDETTLAEVERLRGESMVRVGVASSTILRSAQAMAANGEIVLQPPSIPHAPYYVMFDLEGLPPQLDELEKVYLWGLQLRGGHTGPYVGVTAGFGPDGDREGWLAFLAEAGRIFTRHGDVPFVHWAADEKTNLARYIARFGDPDRIARRVDANLVDLQTALQASIVLPLASYSLPAVERYVGFERSIPEANGDSSVAAFIEAAETDDRQRRAALIQQIGRYNREDLDATWAVLRWLLDRAAGH